jgi:hypothetical protein
MGKSCVFAPIIFFFVIFGGLIFAFLAFILKIVGKTKKDYWIGTVQDKKYSEKRDTEIGDNIGRLEHFYTLVVKTDDGKIRNIAVSSEMYGQCQPGDRLEKKLGDLNPKKI